MHCDYLIVGGKGFLGSYITASLIEAGIDVFAPTHEAVSYTHLTLPTIA